MKCIYGPESITTLTFFFAGVDTAYVIIAELKRARHILLPFAISHKLGMPTAFPYSLIEAIRSNPLAHSVS